MQELIMYFANWFGEPFIVGGKSAGMRGQIISLILTLTLICVISLSVFRSNNR